MTPDIKPVEGYVALQLIDADEETDPGDPSEQNETPEQSYNEPIYAIVVGIGPKGPSGIKKGQTVLVRKYARDGVKIADGVVLVETYCIIAAVGS